MHAAEIRLDLRALAFTSGRGAAMRHPGRTASGMAHGARATCRRRCVKAGRGLVAGHHRVRSALVVVQVAAALMLLVGAGLLVRSFQQVLAVPPGFDDHNLVTISTQMPSAPADAARGARFTRRSTTG